MLKNIWDFYQCEEYLWFVLEKKSLLLVTIQGVKCHKLKSLLLLNLKELHIVFLRATD